MVPDGVQGDFYKFTIKNLTNLPKLSAKHKCHHLK